MATYINPGLDASGNGNNWTTNNINWIAPGTTYDVMTDVPTNTNSNTANYATLNPINVDPANPSGTITNGNLSASNTTSQALPYSTIGFTTGKYYFEFILTALPSTATAFIGVCTSPYAASNLRAYRYDTGQYFNGTTWVSYGATWTTNDVIGTAIDMTNQTIEFYKNGTSQGQITSLNLTGLNIFPMFYMNANNAAGSINFGQRPFAYTPPSGFYPLNTYNLPTPTILDGDQYFNATIYTGTGSAQSITNSGSMQPDFIWFKSRGPSTNLSNALTDTVRGINLVLNSNNTAAEATDGVLTSFNTNGFTTGASANSNKSGDNFVAWQWRANAGTNVSNTQGTITSTVSANTTSGFSIVTWTGNGSTSTVGHGLSVAPSMIIVKRRDAGGSGWSVYFTTLPAGYVLSLQSTNGEANSSNRFTTTLPTSTVFSIGTDSDLNASGGTYVAYCFAQVAGYSAFGSYVGNSFSAGADGTFVYLGFRPRFVLVKLSSSSGYDWVLYDSARSPTNVTQNYLNPNTANSENAGGTVADIDFLSNGFKLRNNSTSAQGTNIGNQTYIYAAFAENPFKIARAR